VALTGTSVIERARKNITTAEFDCATIVMVWLCSIATARTTFDSGMERRKWIFDLERHGIPTGKSQFLDGIHTGVSILIHWLWPGLALGIRAQTSGNVVRGLLKCSARKSRI
jgi:hypothetical protein